MNATPPEPNNQYRAEAREPGEAPFEFDTPTGETARAMCDAHGWELIRVYEPGKDADRPAQETGKGDPALTHAQIQALAIEAGKTWRMLQKMGLTDFTQDEWRREQVKAKVKRDGLSKCQNSHYAKLMRHFKELRGEKAQSVPSLTGPQSAEGGDNLERREQIILLITAELEKHARRVASPSNEIEWAASEAARSKGGAIGAGYMMSIVRQKNPGVTITDAASLVTLTAAKLEHLLFTLRNRIASREGKPTQGRNKGQKKKKGDA